MTNSFRTIIAVVLVSLLVVGGILAYIQTEHTSQIQANAQTTICGNTYPSKIAPSQTATQTCQITSDSWFDIRVSGDGNFSLTVFTGAENSTGGSESLYSFTGSHLSTSFPVNVDSSATVSVQNLELRPLVLKGYVNVTSENTTIIALTTNSHEFRDAGVLLILGSLVALFFLILDTERVSKKEYVATSGQ